MERHSPTTRPPVGCGWQETAAGQEKRFSGVVFSCVCVCGVAGKGGRRISSSLSRFVGVGLILDLG